jgi:hypothetical protein
MTKIRSLVRHQWAGLIALFLVLTGGSAYALDGTNTVFSDDIVNGEVKEADVGQGAVASPELKNDSIVAGDVAPNSLTSPRIADGSLTGADVSNNSLKGADVDESTLDVGDAARAYAVVKPLKCTGEPVTCSPVKSKGISSVTREDVGRYCVTAPGIDNRETPAAVTVDWQSTPYPEGNASAMVQELVNEGCGPSGEGFPVHTQRQPPVSLGVGEVVVSGLSQQANDVAFSIVIP